MMTLLIQINMVTSLILVILVLTFAHADDFEELRMENEIGTYTNGYLKNRDKNVQSLKLLNGAIVFEDDLLMLSCKQTVPTTPFVGIFPPFKNIVYPKKLAIRDCLPPNASFAETLQDLNINVPTIEFLQFATFHIDAIPKGNYMEGFHIKTLFIDSLSSGNIFEKNPDFLKPLSNLTTLMVWGTQVPELPENVHLEVLSIRHHAWAHNWTNCQHLKMLSIHDVMASFFPRYWPEDCRNLTKIRLKGLDNAASHQVMASDISTSSVNLESLYMQHCNLSNPPYGILKNAQNLKHLNFTGNRITDQTLIQIPLLPKLTNLDLSKNFLTGTKLFDTVKQTPNLRYLNLDGNRRFVTNFCNLTEIKELASHLTLLEKLSLNNVPIDPDCFEHINFSKLEYLNLASTENTLEKVEMINLRKLPSTDANRLVVDLRGRQIKWIEFNSDDYLALRNEDYHHLWGSSTSNNRHHRPQLTVLLNTTEYDCRNYWFCLALLEYPDLITCPDCKCPRSKKYFKEDFKQFNCTVEYQGCFVKSAEEDGDHVVLQCDDNVEFVNNIQGLSMFTRVNWRNYILGLRNMNLAESYEGLEWLGLRDNNSSYLNISNLSQLFKNPKRSILLSKNNSFICDCKTFEEFQKFKSQIENYDQIICPNKNKTDQVVSPEELCKKPSYKSTFIATACIIFTVKIIFLVWWYKDVVKRFLIRKGWCKCCCKSDLNDTLYWQTVQPNIQYSQQNLFES